MERRPTIQTTVTASLTKSSLGACNQMLPVKFASKFVCPCVFKKKKSHLSLLSIDIDGASRHHRKPPPFFHTFTNYHHPSSLLVLQRCSRLLPLS